MSIEPKLSRFSVLDDDVAEPIGKKPSSDKSKKKKPSAADQKGKGPGGDATKKKGSAAKGKSLKSLAFGSASEGKKKVNSQSPALQQNGNQLINGAIKRPSAQWDDWQKRDHEHTDQVYEGDLEAALVQSQVDFQNELARLEAEKAATGKSGRGKKKGITIPLNEFNSIMLLDTPKSEGPPNLYPNINDEELIEKFRAEAKAQLEKEKEIAQQRELLAKRQAEGVYKHPHSKERAKDVVDVDEQSRTIENLKAENELLKSELESYKSRLKKVHDIFQSAQELKDKAKLIFQVDNLTKIQEDLQEQVQELHSQLEIERSKSHAAINEHRKLLNMERTRRRTNTEAST